MEWRLAEAKNKLSEVVDLALSDGPQLVLRRKDAVIIIAKAEYERLTGRRPSFKEFLLSKGPTLEGVDLSRDRSEMREVDL